MVYVDTPLAAEKLSVSQPLIRGNFSSADTTMGIDHYPFTNLTTNNGKHKQITLPAINLPGVAPASGTGYACINVGVAGGSANTNFLYFTNQSYPQAYILNAVRAFGMFDGRGTAGACTLNNGNGLTFARNASAGSYTGTITNTLVTGSNYLVFVSSQGSGTAIITGYSIVNSTTFNIGFQNTSNTGVDPVKFSVMVVQA